MKRRPSDFSKLLHPAVESAACGIDGVESGAGHLDRTHRFCKSQYSDDSLEIVGEHLQAHFSCDVTRPACQEVCRTHPVLKRAEHVFDRAASQRHYIGPAIQPALLRLKYHLLLPSPDAPVVGRLTLALEGTARALRRHSMSSACNSNVLQVGACGYELLGVVIHQLHYRLSIARQFCKRIVTRIGVRKVGKLTRKPVLLSQWTYSGYCMTCSLRAVRRLTLTAQRYAGVFFV
jgi:hypothetical protein